MGAEILNLASKIPYVCSEPIFGGNLIALAWLITSSFTSGTFEAVEEWDLKKKALTFDAKPFLLAVDTASNEGELICSFAEVLRL